MRKLALLLLLVLVTPSLLAQDWRDRRGDRYDHSRDNSFELTPFAGYRWGGTLYSNTGLFNQDVDLESSANFGVSLGIPIGGNLKVELLADHSNTNLTTSNGAIFGHNNRVGKIDVNYFQAGLQIPFSTGRGAVPFVVVSAGVANLDPKVAGASSANRFSASAGIGVKVPINRNAGFRIEGRGFYTSTNNSNDNCHGGCYGYYSNRDYLYQGEANIGIYFKF